MTSNPEKQAEFEIPQEILEYHRQLDAQQEPVVKRLGDAWGYGRLMQLAQKVWRMKLKEQGLEGGEFIYGPCRSMVVDCPCPDSEETGHCDWCCGSQYVTKKVLEAMQTRTPDLSRLEWQPIEAAPRNAPIEVLLPHGLSFIGDVWDCSMRTDIEEDELLRLRCFDGHIATTLVHPDTMWRHLDLPKPRLKKCRK